jgi:hypothetical protein
MSILLKGLKMPEGDNAVVVVIHSNGTVDRPNWQWDCTLIKGAEAISIPDHGDLIDRDKFVAEKREQFCADCRKRKSTKTGLFVYEIGDCVCRACDTDDMLDYIEEAPVVIPAERSEE